MNDYGSNDRRPYERRSDVIGNGSQIGRPTRPEQRRPARQFPQEDEHMQRNQRVSQPMRTQANGQISRAQAPYGQAPRAQAPRTQTTRPQQSMRTQSTREQAYYNQERRPARRSDEYDYLPPRSSEAEKVNRRTRYQNIGHENVNAGYQSVPGRVRKNEKDFDDYNYDLNQSNRFDNSSRRSRQIDFDANTFDDFDEDELFEALDIDEFGESTRRNSRSAREEERMQRKQHKAIDDTKNKRSDIVFLIVACFEAALSLFLIVLLIIVDILPTVWFILAIAILVIIAAGLIITQIKKINRNKKLRIAGRVISIFMCIVLIAASYFVALTKQAIDNVSKDTGYVINQVHVAVLATDSAESLKDIKDETCGTISSFKPLILHEAMDDFEKQIGGTLKTKDYTNPIELIDALYSKETRVIIFNNDQKDDMVEKHEDFESEVKILYTFKSKTLINIKSNTDVDVTTEPFLFYISGNDEYGELSMGGRSDVNMLVAVNPVSREVLLISVPRDYYVPFAGVSGTARDKITHAGIYGIDTQMATLAEQFGKEVDFYCYVNFSSLIDIVDTLGGITVNNEFEFTSIEGFHFPAGPIELDGLYTLNYVREREAFIDGDFARGRHQQEVIEIIIHKLLSSTGLTVYSQLVNTLERVCTTSMPKESISALIKKQLAEGGTWNISKVQAEGVPMTQPSYASGGIGLSVVMPYSGSISNIRSFLNSLYAGEPVQAHQLGDNDDWSYVITPLPVPEEETESSEEESSEDESSEEGGGEDESSEEGGGEDESSEEIIIEES